MAQVRVLSGVPIGRSRAGPGGPALRAGVAEREAGASVLNRRGSPNKKRRQKRYDPLNSAGGYTPEARSFFDKLIHHPKAFAVVSIIGGVVFVGGIFLAFSPPSTSRTLQNAARPQDTAVHDATAGVDTGSPSANASASGTPGATATPAPQRQYNAAPPFTIDPAATYTATIHTGQGDIAIQLDAKAAPQTVNDFVFLAQNRFYDGLSFQQVTKGFAAQAGAPQADGTGGAGYTIPLEDSSLKHDAGAVATALDNKTGQWSGSQFYVCLQAIPQQDGKDTVFGHVTQGLNILQALPSHNPSTDPTSGLTISSITITKQ